MLHRCVYYRRVPPFRPGKGHRFYDVLFDSRLSVPCRGEAEKFSSVAVGMVSETIATYIALKAGMIGQHRHSTPPQSYSTCSNNLVETADYAN